MSDEDERTGTAEAEAPAADPGLARLRADLEAATRRAEDFADRLKRAQADYENLRKRSAREAEEVRDVANEALLASLLPVLDDFDHALAALQGDAAAGVRLLRENLWKALAAVGLEALAPAGEPLTRTNTRSSGRRTMRT
jgi:molecular chaperone GrpE